MASTEHSPQQLVEVYVAPPREAERLALVLHALNIPHHLLRAGQRTHILTPPSHADRARRELAQYLVEAPLQAARPTSADRRAGLIAACAWTASLAAAHFRMPSGWREEGSSLASKVCAGEWWRTITALTLHADIVHLLSNLVFGALFIGLLAAETSVGTALFLTLLGGALGNGANALITDMTHNSIGASTAVFASLGVLVGGRFRVDRASVARGRAWVPLVAGLALLGWLGGPSERVGPHGPIQTDVTAHLLGLLCGLILGVALLTPKRELRHERWMLAGTSALLISAWALAIS